MKKIYINIPVGDLERSTQLYEAIGFEKQVDFSTAEASGMKWSDEIFFMLLTHDFTRNFIEGKEIADMKKMADGIFALEVDNNEMVDEIVKKAESAGARVYRNEYNQKFDFMYTFSIEDFDGHILEIFHMDMSKFEKI